MISLGVMQIRTLGPGDAAAVAEAGHLFDTAIDAGATARFLVATGHHLLIAYDNDRPVGFVSGVELTHPDKGTEMFLYELAVDESARRRGIGTALVQGLITLARERGCYGMFVFTDDDNAAARGTYRRSGGREVSQQLMVEWLIPAS
jgi:ribosomal protein S18 acetylase RimI-like enzyme